jgi:hypothetical protein
MSKTYHCRSTLIFMGEIMKTRCIRYSGIAILLLAAFVILEAQGQVNVPEISNVSISRPQFNPSNGENLKIAFSLNEDSKVAIKIYDPDHGLIRYLVYNKECRKGINTEVWDGKDDHNEVVPDEAYFFTIEAHSGKFRTMYDPTASSGGEEIYLDTVRIDQEAGTVNYFLKKATRILFRTGIENGPLLATLEDWKPRPRGENTVYWSGTDETGKIRIAALPSFKMTVGGFELPENSVIAYGNKKTSYFEYKEKTKPKETKERGNLKRGGAALSRHYFLDRNKDRSPKVKIKFPSIADARSLPQLKDRVIVQVDLGQDDKKYFTLNLFEIVFAVDGQYFMEETNGYVPYNWVWDTTQFPDGEHLLTVNVASLNDQIGASSLKVAIKNH